MGTRVTRRSQSSPVSGHSPPGGDLTQQDLMFMEFTDPQSSRWYHVEKHCPALVSGVPACPGSQFETTVLRILAGTDMGKTPKRQEQICFKILSVVCKQIQRDFDAQLQTELVYFTL